MRDKSLYWIYMLRLNNGSYYTGYSADLEKRFSAHRRGRGAKITRSFTPLSIAACWKLRGGRGAAMRVEALIKGCTREQKQTLIDHPESLQRLLEARGVEQATEAVIPPPSF